MNILDRGSGSKFSHATKVADNENLQHYVYFKKVERENIGVYRKQSKQKLRTSSIRVCVCVTSFVFC